MFSDKQFITSKKDCFVSKGEVVDQQSNLKMREGHIIDFPRQAGVYHLDLKAYAMGGAYRIYKKVEFKVSDCSVNVISDPDGVWPGTFYVPKTTIPVNAEND